VFFRKGVAAVLLALTVATAGRSAGEEARLPTDADIVTATDSSSSITNADLALEYVGLA